MMGYQKGVDIEAGTSGGGTGTTAPTRGLYPGMTESPELRWALIRKIYVILSLQLLLTAVVAAVVVKVRAIPHFFVSSSAGLGLYIFLIIFPFIGEASNQHSLPLFRYEFVPGVSVRSDCRQGFRDRERLEYIPFLLLHFLLEISV
uniref:Uncharacterized protein n=1 Tax=Aegilops tauschii subsp. strangulata TaxID=200361 RepID=A0A453GL20_AEGTS